MHYYYSLLDPHSSILDSSLTTIPMLCFSVAVTSSTVSSSTKFIKGSYPLSTPVICLPPFSFTKKENKKKFLVSIVNQGICFELQNAIFFQTKIFQQSFAYIVLQSKERLSKPSVLVKVQHHRLFHVPAFKMWHVSWCIIFCQSSSQWFASITILIDRRCNTRCLKFTKSQTHETVMYFLFCRPYPTYVYLYTLPLLPLLELELITGHVFSFQTMCHALACHSFANSND